MSISTNRVKYIDKETSVLARDFVKDLVDNDKIFTNLIAPLLDDVSLQHLFDALQKLDDLRDNFTSIFNMMNDLSGNAMALIQNVLKGLNLNDPRLQDIKELVSFLISDTSGANQTFLTALFTRGQQAIIDNPALVNAYDSITPDSRVRLILAALSDMAATMGSAGLTPQTLDNLLTGLGEDTGVVVDTSTIVDVVEQVTDKLADKWNITPNYNNTLLNPVGSKNAAPMTSAEFASCLVFMKAYSTMKVEAYRLYTTAMTSVDYLFKETTSTNPRYTDLVANVTKFCLNSDVDNSYGYFVILNMLEGLADRVYERLSSATTSESEKKRMYKNYIDFIVLLLNSGLYTHEAYTDIDKVYKAHFYDTVDSQGQSTSIDLLYKLSVRLNQPNPESALEDISAQLVVVMKSLINRAYPTANLPQSLVEVMIAVYLHCVLSGDIDKAPELDNVPHSGQYWKYLDTNEDIKVASVLDSFDIPHFTFTQGFVTKNKAFLLTGVDKSSSEPSAKVFTADINEEGAVGSWSEASSLPISFMSASIVATKKRIYAIGGADGNRHLDDVYTTTIAEDGSLTGWTLEPKFIHTTSGAQLLVTGKRLYHIGGYLNRVITNKVFFTTLKEDGTIAGWTGSSGLPSGVANAKLIVTRTRVYVIGGINSSGNPSALVYWTPLRPDGSLGEWNTGTSLPECLYLNEAVATNERVYLFGGMRKSTTSAEDEQAEVNNTVYSAPINPEGSIGAWSSYSFGASFSTTKPWVSAFFTKGRLNIIDASAFKSYSIEAGESDYSYIYDKELVGASMAQKTTQLQLCTMVAKKYKDISTTTTAASDMDAFFTKFPKFINVFIRSSLMNKIPTGEQALSQTDIDFNTVWSTVRGKAATLKTIAEYAELSAQNAVSLKQRQLSSITRERLAGEVVQKAFDLFEEEDDLKRALDTEKYYPYSERNTGLRRLRFNPANDIVTLES